MFECPFYFFLLPSELFESASGSNIWTDGRVVFQEGVTVLKQMLEMEAWQRVPIPLKVSWLRNETKPNQTEGIKTKGIETKQTKPNQTETW